MPSGKAHIPWLSVLLTICALASLVPVISGGSTFIGTTLQAVFLVVQYTAFVAALVVGALGVKGHFASADPAVHKRSLFKILGAVLLLFVACLAWGMKSAFTSTYGMNATSPIVPQAMPMRDAQAMPGSMPQANPAPTSGVSVYSDRAEISAQSMAEPMPPSAVMPAPGYYPGYSGNGAVTDTRELLKTSYSATMQTRDVQTLTRKVETTVRGNGGRIDSTSASKDYGAVSFVVPVSKYDAFRTDLESLVDSRFLEVNISSQNMLPQKQYIEGEAKQVNKSIAQLTQEKTALASAHTKLVQSLNAQVTSAETELSALYESLAVASESARASIQSQAQILESRIQYLRERLSAENQTYAWQKQNLDAQIQGQNQNLDAVKEKDKNLMDDVATVNGYVSVRHINLWQFVTAYVPGYVFTLVFVVLAVGAYIFERRRA